MIKLLTVYSSGSQPFLGCDTSEVKKNLATHNWWKPFNVITIRWNKTDNVNIIKLITLSLSKSPCEKTFRKTYCLM